MSDNYTPSWERRATAEYDSVEDYPEDFQYGSGLDHTPDWEMDSNESETTDSLEEEPSWGEERHPTLLLATPFGDELRYLETVKNHALIRTDCNEYVIQGEVDRFPPETNLELQVHGVREGDTDRVPVTVESAGPLTLKVKEESGTLYRYWATGCLACGGDTA